MSNYPVSYHAVLRYLTRTHKIKLRGIEKSIEIREGTKQLALEACRQLGLDFDRVCREILPERFLPCLPHVHRIRLKSHVCQVAGGRVVTVLPPRGLERKVRILSRRESRHGRRRRQARS